MEEIKNDYKILFEKLERKTQHVGHRRRQYKMDFKEM
jgi:hypothetical protein